MFARLTPSQAISQSFRVFIPFITAQRRPSGEVELTAACRWDARSTFDPVAGRYVKAAADVVSKELWRQLLVRRLARGVPGRRRQRGAVQRDRDSVKQRPFAMLS